MFRARLGKIYELQGQTPRRTTKPIPNGLPRGPRRHRKSTILVQIDNLRSVFNVNIFYFYYYLFFFKAFATTGTNLQLMFTPNMPSMASYHQPTIGYCDFEKEQGMVRISIIFVLSLLLFFYCSTN